MIENNTIFLPRVQCISIPIAKIKFFKEFNEGKKTSLEVSCTHLVHTSGILFGPTNLAKSYRCSTYVKNLQIHTILIENIRCEYL